MPQSAVRYGQVVLLDCPTAEALSQVAVDDGWCRVGELKFTSITLTGIVELARSAYRSGSDSRADARRCLSATREGTELFESIWRMLDGEFDPQRPRDHWFSAPESELWLVRNTACLESDEFSLFLQRFKRSLAESGFGLRFPYALSQALAEMAENVVRHSAASGSLPSPGVVGYHVQRERMNYVVADLGRGVLNSLRENPKWRGLKDEGDALVAAAKDGATRLPEHTEGDGFRLAFQAFLDRKGILAMRSGDGVVRLQGNLNGREAEVSNGAALAGLRVSAWCDLQGETKEIPFRS